MASGDRLLLLDTASLYFRAFFGVPDSMRAPDGTPVNAVRGLLDFISRLVGEYDPTHLVCCWDDDWRPRWRVDLIPSYKAHRVVAEVPGPKPDVEEVPDPLEVQIPIIVDVLQAFGIARVGHAEMEADDVIGTLATNAGMPVDIVTGDRDLFQLVDDEAAVRVLYVARGVSKHERVDNAWVRNKYGVDARHYADLATLRGDASDGLPGVAGVGDKTAATLLNRFGSIDAVVAAASDPESDMGPGPRGKIKAALDYLDVAPGVVAVRRDLDLGSPDTTRPRTPADHDAVVALDERWGLGSSAVRLVQALSGSD
jgi:5'-3' exonuclease